MNRSFSMGQFKKKQSIYHKLPSVIKLYILLLEAIFSIIFTDIRVVAGLCVVDIILVMISEIKLHELYYASRKMMMLSFVMGLFAALDEGASVLWTWKWFALYSDSLYNGAVFFVRMMAVVVCGIVFCYGTSPRDIIKALKKGLMLNDDYAMSVLIALNFIAVLSKEMERIRKAEACRGVDLTYGSLRDRIGNAIFIIGPLIRFSLNRADMVADSLDLRCYHSSEKR